MANTNKTKAELLQELESIKGLLLEEDDIPILQDTETISDEPVHHSPSHARQTSPYTNHESVLPGQGSLFGDSSAAAPSLPQSINEPKPDYITTTTPDTKYPELSSSQLTNQPPSPRPLAKASGENPFLPQHIRDRLHGNNPPPLFEYETAKKILSATKNVAHKINKPRQYMVDDVIKSLMPQIESELRHRLFAMSVEDLEKLLNEDED